MNVTVHLSPLFVLKYGRKFLKTLFLSLALLHPFVSICSNLDEAYLALKRFDYFKAREQFYRIVEKKPDAYAGFGLALIFKRSDNPFHQLDSASKYIHLSLNSFKQQPLARNFSGFIVDESSIQNMLDSIAADQLKKITGSTNYREYDLFLLNNYLAGKQIINQAIYLRDELEFNLVMQVNKSDSTRLFIQTHPLSSFYSDALLLKDRQVYDEQTYSKTAASYIQFIKRNPKNVMIPAAHEQLFFIYQRNSDISGLKSFVNDYPTASQNLEAWKLLFALSVHSFSDEELIRFLAEYPQFPLKKSILKDLRLSRLNLYVYRKDGFVGFIDSTPRVVITPEYDSVSSFNEGLSVVSRNDSVFYINKANENVFETNYEEAYPFHNGLAAVKQQNKWFFINRQGQGISSSFEEINEISDNMYVIRFNGKYGAIDHFGQKVFDARFDILGDFKNGQAYYQEDGLYGFVSAKGMISRIQFDWISDFDLSQLAIFRRDNKFGLIHSSGKIMLEAKYDFVLRADQKIYIVVQGNSYGFYSAEGCFITQVIYDYQKEKPENYYCEGRMMRLVKNNTQALMDENGVIRVNFGQFDEIGFPSNGLYRAKKKNKYGFVDKKLQTVIPFQFEWAGDFEDSFALVKIKENYKLISVSGKEMISSASEIEKISAGYYLLKMDGIRNLYNSSGRLIVEGVKSIQALEAGRFIITLNNDEIKLLKDETFVNLKSKT